MRTFAAALVFFWGPLAFGADFDFPKGSLVLLRGNWAHGVGDLRLSGKTQMKEVLPGYGEEGPYLLLDLDRRLLNVLRVPMERAWVSSSLDHAGDLSRFFEKGALAFDLRCPQGLDGIEIGFGEADEVSVVDRAMAQGLSAEEALALEPQVTLPLHDYALGHGNWESVLIPLSDFSKGYFHWMVPDETGAMGGRIIRRPWNFRWKRATHLILMAPPFRQGPQRFELRNMALVPGYSRRQAVRARQKAKDLRGLPWPASRHRALIADRPAAGLWAYGGQGARVVMDEAVRKEGRASARFEMFHRAARAQSSAQAGPGVAQDPKVDVQISVEPQDSWAGMGLPEMDLLPCLDHGAISFWVKGILGDESFGLTLGSRDQGRDIITISSPDMRFYGEVGRSWKRAVVPLVDFRPAGGFDWSRVVELGFWVPPVDEIEITFHVDDLRILCQGDWEGTLWPGQGQP